MHRRIALICLLPTALLAVHMTGCQSDSSPSDKPYKTAGHDPKRNTPLARQLTDEAVELIAEGRLDKARRKLESALAADLFYGPAHNNLGSIHLREKNYYQAAWEFQYAAKLMPEQYKPKNNLGLVFEQVGQLDKATTCYEDALALAPESVDVAANLARAYVRAGRKDEKTRELLTQVLMQHPSQRWTSWARQTLTTMGQPKENE
jgi:tetratricopeptide (TPR) repeat protein